MALRKQAYRPKARVLFTLSAAMGLLWHAPSSLAVDLEWANTTPGLLFYDTAGNWNPAQTPTNADNVLFNVDISDPIIMGASSDALNVTFADFDWELTGAAGGTFNSDGLLTIDDPTGTNLSNGTSVVASNNLQWDNLGNIIVGDTGFGSLTLQDSTDLLGSQVLVGNQVGSSGQITLTGAGTVLTARLDSNTGVITIGNDGGMGRIDVLDDADLRTTSTTGNDIWVGSGLFDADPIDPLNPVTRSLGILNVNGAGSFVETEDLNVGIFGGIGFLNITNGGQVINTDGGANGSPDTSFGVNDGPSGEKASGSGLVDGDNSLLRSRRINVGNNGTGQLIVSSGGEARTLTQGSSIGDMYIGNAAGSDGKTAVFGNDSGGTVNSLLDVDNNLYVGNAGLGQLNIGLDLSDAADGNGSLQVDGFMYIGDDAGNNADNKVVVSGANATANVGSTVRAGNAGTGTLEVLAGASFTVPNVRVGEAATGDGTLLVDGTGTELLAIAGNGSTVVGTNGLGDATISDGALFRTDQFWIGYQGNADGTVTVDNATVHAGVGNSSSNHDLVIGGRTDGSGGTGALIVQNGSYVRSSVQTVIGGNATGVGSLTVTGVGSVFDNFDNGAGSASNDILRIGQNGAGTTQVLDGGRIEAEGILIGHSSTNAALAASLTVSGTNGGTPSTVDTGGYLFVGNTRPATMTVDQGAQVSVATSIATERLIIGDDNSADGSKLTISDLGSRVDYHGTADIAVGNAGGSAANRATLEVLNGGVFSAVQTGTDARIIVGDVDNGNGHIIVDGAGSLVEARVIYLGDGNSNSTGLMDITNGGTVDILNEMEVGSNGGGDGTVNIDGPTSSLNVGTFLSLGDDVPGNGSAVGIMNITEGATVATGTQAYLGHYTGTTGTATVGSTTANTSTWDIDGELTLAGTEGSSSGSGSGTLNVNTGGLVDIASNLRIRNLGDVNLDGGEIRVGGNILFTDAGSTFNFNTGTLRYTNAAGYTLTGAELESVLGVGPTLVADQHIAVNGLLVFGAPLRVNGGTLSIGSINAANMAMVDFDAGTINLTDTSLVVTNAGLFGKDLTIQPDQTINVTNNTFIQSDGTMTVVGNFSTGGTITNNGDLALIDSTGSGKTLNGTLVTPAGSTVTLIGDITFNDSVSGAGGFFGPGTATFAGGFSPGDSPATVTFEGDVVLESTNTLFLEIGGVIPGTEHDRLEIDGTAMIDGTLNVSLINGFTPSVGNNFGFLFANGGFGGNFDTLNLPDISGLGLQWTLNPGGSTVFLEVDSLLTGDLDGDGFVGINDLNIVLGNWNQNVPPANPLADPSGDGFVGIDDLNAVLGNWNAGTPPTAQGNAAVPEPTTGVLLLVTGCACISRQCRKYAKSRA